MRERESGGEREWKISFSYFQLSCGFLCVMIDSKRIEANERDKLLCA